MISSTPYEHLREVMGRTAMREDRPSAPVSEMELQARFFNGEYGTAWEGQDGERIDIRHFGTWNREPGPDFCGARLLIDGQEVSGDIELDPEAADWERHGHSTNPSFNEVRLHVFFRPGRKRFFTRTAENRRVVQVCLSIASPKASIVPVKSRGGILPEEQRRRLVEEAAKFRFLRKRQILHRLAQFVGLPQALFQSVATALGYKYNKIPFLLVAQRAGWERAASAEGEALLFGLAGFLDAREFESLDEDSRSYLRRLWETWWRIQDHERRLVLPAGSWKFATLRPANHPHRRMGALTAFAVGLKEFVRSVEGGNVARFKDQIAVMQHEFWNFHFNLKCDVLNRRASLIGEDRVLDIVINAFIPLLDAGKGWQSLVAMKGPTPNRKVAQAADWLGWEPKSSYLLSAMHQQGLVQLWDDFAQEDPVKLYSVINSQVIENNIYNFNLHS